MSARGNWDASVKGIAGSPIRPGAGLGNIVEANSPGTSSYNALWLTLNKFRSRAPIQHLLHVLEVI